MGAQMKYEYEVVHLDPILSPKGLDEELDKLGECGWALVHVIGESNWIFMREKNDKIPGQV